MSDNTKTCINCKLTLPKSDFKKHSESIDGFQHKCRKCSGDPPKTRIREHNQEGYLIKIECNKCLEVLSIDLFTTQGYTKLGEIVYYPTCNTCLKEQKLVKQEEKRLEKEQLRMEKEQARLALLARTADEIEEDRINKISDTLSSYYQTPEGHAKKKEAHQKRSETMKAQHYTVTEKECRKCKITQPATQFCKKSAARDGLQSYCITCTNKAKEAKREAKRQTNAFETISG